MFRLFLILFAILAISVAQAPSPDCHPNEVIRQGACKPCPPGQVADDDYNICRSCEDNGGNCIRCKSPGGVEVGGVCIAPNEPGYPCQPNEVARNGQCKACQPGQVAGDNRKDCRNCEDGGEGCSRCRPPGGVEVGGVCIAPYLYPCGSNQVARNGKCATCGAGKVASNDHKDCLPCESDNINCARCRPPGGVEVGGVCIPPGLGYPCKSTEVARNGQCKACQPGQVANDYGNICRNCEEDASDCSRCRPRGGVEVDGVCIAADEDGYPCHDNEVARNGQCKPCLTGPNLCANDDHTTCVVCPPS